MHAHNPITPGCPGSHSEQPPVDFVCCTDARSYASVVVWHKDEASFKAAPACGSAQFKEILLLGRTIKIPVGRVLYTYPVITTTTKKTTAPPLTTTSTLDPHRCKSQVTIYSLKPSSDGASVTLQGRWSADASAVALCRWWYVSTSDARLCRPMR